MSSVVLDGAYVVDGIRTTMAARDGDLACPCGWRVRHGMVDDASLRWHYDHCRQARGFVMDPEIAQLVEHVIADGKRKAELQAKRAPSPDSQEPSKATEA
jgi:hypothetical protein